MLAGRAARRSANLLLARGGCVVALLLLRADRPPPPAAARRQDCRAGLHPSSSSRSASSPQSSSPAGGFALLPLPSCGGAATSSSRCRPSRPATSVICCSAPAHVVGADRCHPRSSEEQAVFYLLFCCPLQARLAGGFSLGSRFPRYALLCCSVHDLPMLALQRPAQHHRVRRPELALAQQWQRWWRHSSPPLRRCRRSTPAPHAAGRRRNASS